MKIYLVLVAGGSGSRMGSSIPKQFMALNGKPVLYHTIQKFLDAEEHIDIIIVIHPSWKSELNDLLKQYFPEVRFQIIDGGETRFDSVKNGLSLVKQEGLVMIHDAARPLVSVETISRCISETFRSGSAIPVIAPSESIRKIENGKSTAVNRDEFRLVQTPQCFMSEIIKSAYEVQYISKFTDDASVFEHAGHNVNLVNGNPENIKITQPSDLEYAEFLLRNSSNN
ncbi:MAG: 2-C-methyl-D-erythritol 4-phosphate cytidylyltransferase [Bacteroidota bacterium]